MPELRNNNKDLTPLTPAAPLAETPAAEITEAAPAAPVDDLKDVRFDARQQLRLDQIIKESHGRVGSAQRAEITRLKSEMARIQNEKDEANEPLPEVELLRAQLAASQARGDALIQANAADRKAVLLERAASKFEFIGGSEVVGTLLDRNIKYNPATKAFDVVHDDGTVRLNSEYEPMSVDEAMAEYARLHPYLVKGSVKSGAGSVASTQSTLSDARGGLKCEQIFGRGSDASAANRMALRNPSEYKRLRAEAVRKGLIG